MCCSAWDRGRRRRVVGADQGLEMSEMSIGRGCDFIHLGFDGRPKIPQRLPGLCDFLLVTCIYLAAHKQLLNYLAPRLRASVTVTTRVVHWKLRIKGILSASRSSRNGIDVYHRALSHHKLSSRGTVAGRKACDCGLLEYSVRFWKLVKLEIRKRCSSFFI